MNESTSPTTVSTQFRAVLTILAEHIDLAAMAAPYVNFEREEIDWEQIYKRCWRKDQRVCLNWAQLLWRDFLPDNSSLFEDSLTLDEDSLVAIHEALKIRWGLGRNHYYSKPTSAKMKVGAA